jgi:nicotinate-nucleotide adenylyltransferase
VTASDALRIFYGGTFDPVHDGHVAIACAARDACDADVRFVPAGDPAHRVPPGAAARDRAAMVALAIAGIPRLHIDLRELERDGRTWTADTLVGLRAELGPRVPLAWLVGADSFRGLPSWKDWTGLFGLAHFIVAERPGSPLDAALAPGLATALAGRLTDDPAVLRQRPHGRVLRLHQPLQAHSATDLRQRIAAGLPWRGLVAPAVADYIAGHRLYGAPGST